MSPPNMFRIRQRFPSQKLDDVESSIRAELTASKVSIKPHSRIAIAVGSRGIANLPLIVREIVTWVKSQGGDPFIVPAMGSHGGATAEGQRKILERFGIDSAPILSSMDIVELGHDAFIDRHAFEADGIILVNRIKPHTSFHGEFESG